MHFIDVVREYRKIDCSRSEFSDVGIHLSDSFAWKYLINSERSNETHGMLHERNANWTMKWKCHLCYIPSVICDINICDLLTTYFKGELDKHKSKRILQICKLNKVKVEFYKRNFPILFWSFSSLLSIPEIHLKRVYFQERYFRSKFFDERITRVFKIQTKLDINIFKISSIENWILLYGKRAMSDLFRVKIFFVANVSFFVASNARSSLRSTDVVWKNSYSPAKTFCKTTNSQQNM